MSRGRLLAAGVAVLALAAGVAAARGPIGRRAPRTATTTATSASACRPPPRSGRLAAIDGRVPVSLHVPPHARAGLPLVLALGGAGETGGDFARYTGYSHLADRDGFFVAYPTAAGARPSWNVSGTAAGKPDDVAYLRAVIVAAVRASCADPARVGVTGVSNGGGMSARLACDAADLVSAAAPVAGGYGSLPGCHPTRPVPILEIHGTSDRVVPYAGKGAAGFGAVSRFLAQWLRLDGCPAKLTRRSSPEPGVTELRWSPCRDGSALLHDRIQDADHGWPGTDDVLGRHGFSATQRTWAFLSVRWR